MISFNPVLPFHWPIVNGWEGPTSRAHADTFSTSGSDTSPNPPFVGSLYRSQIHTCGLSLKVATTSLTYFSRRGHVEQSRTRLWPGEGVQPLAYQPSIT